jgi:hypothetical protein
MNEHVARVQMEREGYTGITPGESQLYAIVGSKLFFRLMETAFRMGYVIDRRTEPIDSTETYVNCRRQIVKEALDLIAEDKQDYVPMMVLTDREIGTYVSSLEQKVIEDRKKKLVAKTS